MAFVHDDEVEKLGWDGRIVNDFGRFAFPWLGAIKTGAFFVLCVKLGFAFEHRVETLDSGDNDLGCGGNRIGLGPLERVKGRELARVIWRCVVSKLVLGLLTEIPTVDEEKNALGSAEFQQAVGGADGDEGFTRASRHLNK